MSVFLLTFIRGLLMVARKFTVLIEPAEEGGFVVKSLELPVATQGETKEEALANIKEAIEGYVAALQDDGLPVPEDRFDAEVVAV